MKIQPLVLVIDDEESIRIGCLQTLSDEGYKVELAENGEMGIEKIRKKSYDMILLDLKMPGLGGMEVLSMICETDPRAVIVVITGYATIENAVDAMKRGAYDFLPKPFTSDALLAIAQRAIDGKRLMMENICLRLELDESRGPAGIIGVSPVMQQVAEMIRKVALSASTVLIQGETGVGKELVARAIHQHSPRNKKPFVVVDCGALVETLFESELFGHIRGAFTGAIETKHGKFELADGGTIFFDEVANIGPQIQAKLLRAIQEREITKVGSSQKVSVDVRIIAATNKDLALEMKEERFKEDLFYRLSVIPILVPPLRQRREDIAILTRHFIQKYGIKRKKNVTDITDEALASLERYDWPGNVRELENAIERAVVMADSKTIQPEDLLYYGLTARDKIEPVQNGHLAKIEMEEIIKALKQFGGNKSRTADFLGINRKTLREKILRYGIDEE